MFSNFILPVIPKEVQLCPLSFPKQEKRDRDDNQLPQCQRTGKPQTQDPDVAVPTAELSSQLKPYCSEDGIGLGLL